MAESIVRVPTTASGDYDFLGFSFAGKHSWDDFGLIRTSDSDRYNENLAPMMNDKTADVPGGDGMYFFGSTHKQKDFNVSFAFENMTEAKLAEMKKWLNGKEMGDLWFEEAPYKVYTAKVTGTPSLKYIPFTVDRQRVYKGEGTIQFVAYWPYAHTPDKVEVWNKTTSTYDKIEGKSLASYASFTNKDEWSSASGLGLTTAGNCLGENPGQLPTHFIFSADTSFMKELANKGFKVQVDDYYIKVAAEDNPISNIHWDSKTGLLYTINSNDKKIAIPYVGNGAATIPAGGTDTIILSLYDTSKKEYVEWVKIKDGAWEIWDFNDEEWKDGATAAENAKLSLTYHYWYY